MTALRHTTLLLAGLLTLLPAPAQDILKQLDLKALAAKSSETVEVNLDGNLLSLAARFLDDHNADEAKAKQLLRDIKGIYVRSFTFNKDATYTPADLEAVRSHTSGAGWQKIVDVRGSGENTGVYLKSTGDKIDGIVVLSAEKNEFTVVQIVGSVDPANLRDLGGRFGIPKLPGVADRDKTKDKDKTKSKAPKDKDEEEEE